MIRQSKLRPAICDCGCASFKVERRHQVFYVDDRRYRLRSTLDSSHKYGPCHVCGEHASEVFYQSEAVIYIDSELGPCWTYYGCESWFGHEACLETVRNEKPPRSPRAA